MMSGDIAEGHEASQSDAYHNFRNERKLCKRLCYMLRYGAEREGLKVSTTGYVNMSELLKTGPMRHHSSEEVLKEVQESQTVSGKKRFEMKNENGNVYIRALYGRKMERSPFHEGTKVPRLLETCMNHIADNIKQFDLQDFPDDYLVNCIIHTLKRSRRLTNAAFASLLGCNLEQLDLGGTMVTAKTLRLLGQRCPHLKNLNLRDSSYILNDHIMEGLLKNFPELGTLNLCGCSYLTDRTIIAIVKYCPNIVSLNLGKIPDLSQKAILNLVTASAKLNCLNIADNNNIGAEAREILTEMMRQRGMTIILQGLHTDQGQDPDNDPSMTLNLASVGKYW